MNIMSRIHTCTLVILIGLATEPAYGGERGPGKYCGVVFFDRWDSCILYSGIYVMHVSEDVKNGLREYAGKSVQIDATKVMQPRNPGDGLITDFTYVGPSPPTRLTWVQTTGVELRSKAEFEAGRSPTLVIEVKNAGLNEVTIDSSHLAPTLLAKKPKRTHFGPSDGASFCMITRESFMIGSDEPRTHSSGLSANDSFVWTIDEPLPRRFTLSPKEVRSIRLTFNLPEGEYEFLSGYSGDVHGGRGLASNSVAFDVTPDADARLINIPSR